MADNREWGSSTQVSASAVVDLEDTEMEIIDDASDYEMHFNGDGGRKRPEKGSPYMEEASRKFGANVTEAVFEVGKQQARKAWSVYGNIDILRPFFDVEPKEVTRRLLHSLVPVIPSAQRQRVPRELYGPLMVLLTMIALLLFQMKTSGHKVEEGTLMGTAFGVCFTYWLGASSFIWFLCYVCNTRLAFVQILSMVGYALFGHCVVLFMGTVIHTSHDHLYFYILWAVVGGLSSLRMASLVISRTNGKTQRLIVCSVLILLHLLFLLYLHFAYHQIVEEISEVFNEVKAIQPEAPMAGVENAVHERALDGAAEQPLNPVVESDAKSDVETSPESVEANVRHAMAADKGSVINAGLDVGKQSSNLTKQDLGKPLNETIKFPEKVLNSEK